MLVLRILKHSSFSFFIILFICQSPHSLVTFQVRIVLEGVDKFNNLIGSVYYPDGDTAKDLAVELVENVCFYLWDDILSGLSDK